MNESLVVPVVRFLALAATFITFILSAARSRRLLVERGFMDGRYAEVLAAESRVRTRGALKWGLVLAGFAAGLVVADLLRLLGGSPQAAGLGIVVLGAAAGFLAYWRVARREPLDAPPRVAAGGEGVGA